MVGKGRIKGATYNRIGLFLLMLTLVIVVNGMVLAEDGDNVYREDFTYYDIEQLDLNGKFCEIYLSTHEDNLVSCSTEIRETGINLGSDYSIQHQKEGSRLKVWVEGGNGLYLGSLTGKITISVPVGTKVDISNVSGDVYLEGIDADNLYVKNVSGSVEITNVQADLTVETTSGEVIIAGSPGNKDLKSVSGRIRVNNSNGNIRLKTTSGDQYLQAVSGQVDARSISGRIELEDVDGSYDLETTSGDINGTGVYVKGDSFLKSISGDIIFNISNLLDMLSFDLSSTSGSLSVGNIKTKKELIIRDEGYLLKGKTTSGDQQYF